MFDLQARLLAIQAIILSPSHDPQRDLADIGRIVNDAQGV
jgi:hypothetical protein